MASILAYCAKCGSVVLKYSDKLGEEMCYPCQSQGFFKPVPQEYREQSGCGFLREDRKEEFYEKIVKSSPEFEQSLWDRRIEWIKRREQRDREEAVQKMLKANQTNVPRCPTCSSTNLKRITATSKVVNTALFGFFGTKRNKTFHCNSCGYEW